MSPIGGESEDREILDLRRPCGKTEVGKGKGKRLVRTAAESEANNDSSTRPKQDNTSNDDEIFANRVSQPGRW